MPKYKAIINRIDGGRVILELFCREYHAQKLNYVLSRTLDRSVYYDASVCDCDSVNIEKSTSPIVKARRQIARG